jgi:hypothetical protein
MQKLDSFLQNLGSEMLRIPFKVKVALWLRIEGRGCPAAYYHMFPDGEIWVTAM